MFFFTFANGVVGANIPIAAGAAHAIRLKGEDRIVVCIFGDGAINRGPFLEGLNWASVFELPVLFVCEDNGFAATTRTMTLSGGPGPLARAESLGVPGTEVDGNDILAVDTAAGESIARVRAGGGPRFVLARTYRLAGHTAADPGTYRPSEEVESRWKDDPLERCARLLRDAGVAAERLTRYRNSAATEAAAALAAARTAAWPDAALAFTDVQDTGAPRMGAGRLRSCPTSRPASWPWPRKCAAIPRSGHWARIWAGAASSASTRAWPRSSVHNASATPRSRRRRSWAPRSARR